MARSAATMPPGTIAGILQGMHLGVWPNRVAVTGLGCDHVGRRIPPGGFSAAKESAILTLDE